jgi:predicted P-loop ATPase
MQMDKVMAQAYHLFKNGFRFWFDPSEIQRVHSHNRDFEMNSIEEELLLTATEPGKKGDPMVKGLSATQILEHLLANKTSTVTHTQKIRMGQALSKHGYEQTRSKGVTYWLIT